MDSLKQPLLYATLKINKRRAPFSCGCCDDACKYLFVNKGMLATFSQSKSVLGKPRNSKILHCRILFNTPPSYYDAEY